MRPSIRPLLLRAAPGAKTLHRLLAVALLVMVINPAVPATATATTWNISDDCVDTQLVDDTGVLCVPIDDEPDEPDLEKPVESPTLPLEPPPVPINEPAPVDSPTEVDGTQGPESLVGVIQGTTGSCGVGHHYVLFMDNEDRRNRNRWSGWTGATGLGKNITFNLCAMDGKSFEPAVQAGANFAVWLLSGTCPAGTKVSLRHHTNETTRPASWSRVPDGSPTRTYWHRHPWRTSDSDLFADTDMFFCVATGTVDVPNSVFPELGASYGVFAGAQRSDSWQLDRGWLHLDDEDTSHLNHNYSTYDLAQPNNFVRAYGNTEYWLAKVR
jgi:hypothetical protein